MMRRRRSEVEGNEALAKREQMDECVKLSKARGVGAWANACNFGKGRRGDEWERVHSNWR